MIKNGASGTLASKNPVISSSIKIEPKKEVPDRKKMFHMYCPGHDDHSNSTTPSYLITETSIVSQGLLNLLNWDRHSCIGGIQEWQTIFPLFNIGNTKGQNPIHFPWDIWGWRPWVNLIWSPNFKLPIIDPIQSLIINEVIL